MNATHITIVTNGLPDHDFESTLACSQGNDCTRAQNYEWVIPRSPVNDTTGGHEATNCPEANGDYECAPARGEVAIAINGVPFYGPEDGPGGDAVASQHGAYEEDRQIICIRVSLVTSFTTWALQSSAHSSELLYVLLWHNRGSFRFAGCCSATGTDCPTKGFDSLLIYPSENSGGCTPQLYG